MKILLTNDDGIFAEGILALATQLKSEHEILVAAPCSEQSGMAHSFTMYTPLRCDPVSLPGLLGVPCYAISGTPVDCVKLALGNLNFMPDVVISGINHCENRGTDVFYSGTVSAAIEASILGFPAMAVSNIESKPKHLDVTAKVASSILGAVVSSGNIKDMLINVNVPDLEMKDLLGVKTTKLSVQEYEGKYHECVDPRGRNYYWLPTGKLTACNGTEDNDERWGNAGYVTVTPLKYDITDFESIEKYKTILGSISL